MKFQISLLALLGSYYLSAQTGPAGVGTNTASTSQVRFWVKADVGVYNNAGTTLASNGNFVQQWNDQSGQANHATQTTAGRKPVYVTNAANGQPALRFLGTSFVTAGAFPGIANNVGYTYFVVVKDTSFTAGTMSDGAGDYIIDRGLPGSEANELASLKVTSTNKYGFQKRDGGGGGLGGPVSTSTVSGTNFHIIAYRQTPGTSKVYDIFVDGVLEGTVTSSDANYVPPVPQIGHHYQPVSASGMKGYIAEVILYNYNVNMSQVYIIDSYLAAKYGLTVSNDQYAGDASAAGDYDFEVAGIGNYSSTEYNFTASSSVSGGLEITNGTPNLGPGEYLVYGHQSGANSMNFADIAVSSGGPLAARWNRIWYLDWTHSGGGAEQASLTFDMSDGGMPVTPGTASNYKLLYRSGTSGTWTIINTSNPTISGDRITFPEIVYTQGDGYYTIGTLNNTISPLPVELLSFTADWNHEKAQVDLDWETATEQNCESFTVQRSADGSNFTDLLSVPGAGNSHTPLTYLNADQHPLNGLSYYRLKQTDFDGNHSFSNSIPFDLTSSMQNENATFKLFPNPSNVGQQDFSINLDNWNDSQTRLVIHDLLGRVCYSTQLNNIVGNQKVDVHTDFPLSSGMYLVELRSASQFYSRKLIVH